MAWDYRRYGSATDPIHKSHLNDVTGDWGCPTRFRYQRDEAAAGIKPQYDLARPVRGDAACGTAAHETIARALINPPVRDRILAGPRALTEAEIRRVFVFELEREIGPRDVDWGKLKRDDAVSDRVAMIAGLFDSLYKYVAHVVLVEPAFVARVGAHWIQGHLDLVYRPRGRADALAIADWKTGAQRPDPIELDHGWEAGIYSLALHSGRFLPREALDVVHDDESNLWTVSHGMFAVSHPSRYIAERTCAERVLTGVAAAMQVHNGQSIAPELRTFAAFPSEIYHVHLADFVPYKRAGKKRIERPEDLRHFNRTHPSDVSYVAGDLRGPGWLPVKLTEHDIPRVEHRLRNIVGMIRMGRFIDQIGDRCKRCPFARDCLNTGYGLRGDEAKAAERALKGIDDDSADELAVDRD